MGTPDRNPLASIGDYLHTSAGYGITVQIGSRAFRTDPANVRFLVQVADDHDGRDNFGVRSYTNLATDGVAIDSITWQ